MTRHQYGISALVSQTSFRGETVGGVAKFRLFYQAKQQGNIHRYCLKEGLTRLKGDSFIESEGIAPQSLEILQSFCIVGENTFKLGNFTDYNAFFPALLTYFS